MKIPIPIVVAVFFFSFFSSCKKDAVTSPSGDSAVSDIASDIASDATSALTTDPDGVHKLVLRPGPKNGQDTYIAFWNGDAGWANGNNDWAQELSMTSWTNSGLPMGTRSFIRFNDLASIPSTATVLKVVLYLSQKGSSISAPQGNSVYIGSPYSDYPDNSCKIERVTGGNWDESTLTWNTQPGVTVTGSAVIPSSTNQWNYNVAINVTKMVKKMVENPAQNFGFRISQANESPYRSMIFSSSENTNAQLRPKLVVYYK